MDEDDPLNSIDDGIRRCPQQPKSIRDRSGSRPFGRGLEPFNMRREMREGHFDESGFYVLNKETDSRAQGAAAQLDLGG